MKRFADQLQTYAQEVKQTCTRLHNEMDMLAPFLQDKNSRDGMRKIQDMTAELLKSLPVIETIEDKLRAAIPSLEYAQSISMN
jgi:heme oxygenase